MSQVVQTIRTISPTRRIGRSPRLLALVDKGEPAGAQLFGRVRDRFLQQLRGPNGSGAMDALFRIDRDTALREALAAALDKTASSKIRSNTMFILRAARDPSYVEKLLPLLQDESAGRFEGQHLCEYAAMAISTVCQRLDPKIPGHAKTLERARSAMQKMLRGPHGRAAVESLLQIERNAQVSRRKHRVSERRRRKLAPACVPCCVASPHHICWVAESCILLVCILCLFLFLAVPVVLPIGCVVAYRNGRRVLAATLGIFSVLAFLVYARFGYETCLWETNALRNSAPRTEWNWSSIRSAITP